MSCLFKQIMGTHNAKCAKCGAFLWKSIRMYAQNNNIPNDLKCIHLFHKNNVCTVSDKEYNLKLLLK